MEASKGWPNFGKLSLSTIFLVSAKAKQAIQIDSDNISGNRDAAKLSKIESYIEVSQKGTSQEWLGLAATYLVACTIIPEVMHFP